MLQVKQAPSTEDGSPLLVALEGELDLSTVPIFVEAVDDVLTSAPPAIELDMSRLTFIDSSGVGAYVTAFRRAKAKGTKLHLGERSPLVQRVLQIAGVEEALAAESSEA